MKITAAVTRSTGGPFELEDLEIAEPNAGEIRVRIVATGICLSDIGARDGHVPIPHPIVLGHEGAGVVEALGPGVEGLAVGDHVLLNRATCGDCEWCDAGQSGLCSRTDRLILGGVRADGTSGLARDGETVYGQFFGQSSFATHALTRARNATRLDPDLDLALAPAFGCGVLTGAGTVLTNMRPAPGDSIAVFGVGGVGIAALMAARAAGCSTIIAVDRHRSRLDLAEELGATHTLEPGDEPVERAVRGIVRGGVKFSVEATGVPAVVRAAVESLRRGGECALLGVGPATQEITFNQMRIALQGLTVRGCPTGLSEPNLLVPRLIGLFRDGRFPIDKIVTRFAFDDIDRAVDAAVGGTAIKPILVHGR
ncbi:putative zinc-binding alcohol dehydrogenase [Nocardia nova SH22a]|uniref:Putative zinc-binding alcohol dehydrogenase n=1 Tax=Nocardia nova SH22a TaxID=1415166 RepID=W5THY4_9NOCA|nr:NAD(P)-dependent alcohol dehydrogenase [Nocardia nova]AHH18608.1 putative zinc-binding alcohol dehydrogenase [Nocardia nova SH22a]